MGSGGVAIAALPTVICLKVPFSDGLGGGCRNTEKLFGHNKGCKSHNLLIYTLISGKRGIRTLGTVTRTTVFETVPIDHSGIFP